MVLEPIFGSPHKKKKKIQKNKKYMFEKTQKIITVKKGCQNAKKMVKNWLRRFKNTNIKI